MQGNGRGQFLLLARLLQAELGKLITFGQPHQKSTWLTWSILFFRQSTRPYTRVRILSAISLLRVSFLKLIQKAAITTHFPHIHLPALCDQFILYQRNAKFLNRYPTQNGHKMECRDIHMSKRTTSKYWMRKASRECVKSANYQEKYSMLPRLQSNLV